MKILLLLCALACCLSCQRPPSDKHPQLVVAAAANLTDAFAELQQRFTAQSGIPVVLSFGATADLARQIENGAPFDVFAAADTAHVDKLDQAGLLVPGTRVVYARGRLVMWLPPDSPLKVERIEDVTAKEIERIAIAKPDVAPYGQATVESLQGLGIWNQIESKVVYGQSVSQAKQFAATGNAEVAFIPLALVKAGEGRYFEVDERLHQPIDQAIAIIKFSTQQAAARQFVDFLMSDEGQQLMARRGYARPPAQ